MYDAAEVGPAASEGLEVRADALADVGGNVEVLRLPGGIVDDGFAATPLIGGRLTPVGGVLVLEVDALETRLIPNCFVGDFAGDRMPLATLLAGVGVPATVLLRLAAASSRSVCRRAPFAGS